MGEKVTSPNNSLRLLLGIDDSSALSFASLDTPAAQINHQIPQHGLEFACFAPCFVSCYLPRNNHGYQRHTGSQPLLPPALRAVLPANNLAYTPNVSRAPCAFVPACLCDRGRQPSAHQNSRLRQTLSAMRQDFPSRHTSLPHADGVPQHGML